MLHPTPEVYIPLAKFVENTILKNMRKKTTQKKPTVQKRAAHHFHAVSAFYSLFSFIALPYAILTTIEGMFRTLDLTKVMGFIAQFDNPLKLFLFVFGFVLNAAFVYVTSMIVLLLVMLVLSPVLKNLNISMK